MSESKPATSSESHALEGAKALRGILKVWPQCRIVIEPTGGDFTVKLVSDGSAAVSDVYHQGLSQCSREHAKPENIWASERCSDLETAIARLCTKLAAQTKEKLAGYTRDLDSLEGRT